MLAAFAFVSCSKDDAEINFSEGEKATFSVELQALRTNQPFTRSAGETNADPTNIDVKNIGVLIYDAKSGIYVGGDKGKFNKQDKNYTIEDVPCTTGRRKFVVLANLTDSEWEKFKGLTYDALIKETRSITDAKSYEEQFANGKFLLSSEEKVVMIKPGKNTYGEKVEIQPILSRINLNSMKVELKDEYDVRFTVKPVALVLFQATSGSYLFPQSDKAFNLSLDEFNYLDGQEIKDVAADDNFAPDTDKHAVKLADFYNIDTDKVERKGFFVFESDYAKGGNKDNGTPTILCVKAKLELKDKDEDEASEAGWVDNEGYTYYPILVNSEKYAESKLSNSDQKEGITRNHIYNIDLTITGPGVSNPKQKVTETTFSTVCTIKDWVTVTQTVNW